jgi:RecA/RadA recombinase
VAKKTTKQDENTKKTPKTTTKKTEGNFFDDLLKKVGVEMPVAADVDLYSNITFYDTGSYALNAAISGSTSGGIASKVTALAGEESTGKTYIALQIIKSFLAVHPKAHAFIFDSEDDPSKGVASLVERDIDPKRVHIMRVRTIQEFRNSIIRILNGYLETPAEKRLPMFMCLDSLGNLSTHKEVTTIDKELVNEKGEDVADMTRPKLIRGLFRVLSIKLGEAGVPLLITNHTYDSQSSYTPQKEMAGGGGLKYAASTIIFLSKSAYKEGDEINAKEKGREVIGVKLTAYIEKSRFTKNGKSIQLLLHHESGLDRYWGLFDLGLKRELIVKDGNFYTFPDGQKGTRREIVYSPAKYFDSNAAAFDELCQKEFRFGKGEITPPNLEDEPEEEAEESVESAEN